MANWFIALPVEAGPWFDALEPPPGVRKLGPSDLHLTIAFLGAVSASAAAHAFELARTFPLAVRSVRLAKLEALGGRRASAFSALLGEGRAEVERAIGAARDAMFQAAGARPEARPPLAHVTLARPRRDLDGAQRRAALGWMHAVELASPVVRLTDVALYTWSDDRARALFRIDRRHPLAPS